MKQTRIIRILIAALFGAFFVLFAVNYALLFFSGEIIGPTEDLATGISQVFGVLFALIPIIYGIPILIGLIVCTICMFAVKKKLPTAIATLVLFAIYLPAPVFFFFMIGSVYLSSFPLLVLAAGSMAAVYLGAFVCSCIYVHFCRKQRYLLR